MLFASIVLLLKSLDSWFWKVSFAPLREMHHLLQRPPPWCRHPCQGWWLDAASGQVRGVGIAADVAALAAVAAVAVVAAAVADAAEIADAAEVAEVPEAAEVAETVDAAERPSIRSPADADP